MNLVDCQCKVVSSARWTVHEKVCTFGDHSSSTSVLQALEGGFTKLCIFFASAVWMEMGSNAL